jgi:hypothetical protein
MQCFFLQQKKTRLIHTTRKVFDTVLIETTAVLGEQRVDFAFIAAQVQYVDFELVQWPFFPFFKKKFQA